MKKFCLALILLMSCTLRLSAQKSATSDYIKDYHLDEDIYGFNISHTSHLNFKPIDVSEFNEK